VNGKYFLKPSANAFARKDKFSFAKEKL